MEVEAWSWHRAEWHRCSSWPGAGMEEALALASLRGRACPLTPALPRAYMGPPTAVGAAALGCAAISQQLC